MAPECLSQGQMTEKSDIYAFGVMVTEIVCGKKNSAYPQGSNSVLHSVRFTFPPTLKFLLVLINIYFFIYMRRLNNHV